MIISKFAIISAMRGRDYHRFLNEYTVSLVKSREKAGLTQEELAHQMGFSQATISRAEGGRAGAKTTANIRRYLEGIER